MSASDRLRGAGLRVTAPRLAVLDVLSAQPHSETGAVLRAARARGKRMSVQGVYDVLAALTDAGLLRRVQPPHSPARYEIDRGDNHHHLACRRCGVLHDVDCAVGSAPCLTTPQDHGFAVDEADIVFWGLCPTCRSTAVPGSRRHTPQPPLTPGEEQ